MTPGTRRTGTRSWPATPRTPSCTGLGRQSRPAACTTTKRNRSSSSRPSRTSSTTIAHDIDAPGLFGDAVDVGVNGSRIFRVDDRDMRCPAVGGDLLRDFFQGRAGPAREEDLRTFRGELP